MGYVAATANQSRSLTTLNDLAFRAVSAKVSLECGGLEFCNRRGQRRFATGLALAAFFHR
jgi:hypothetical protein